MGRQEQKMRSELAHFRQQLQAQTDASALQLQRLQQQAAPAADSTSEAATILSASTGSSKPPSVSQSPCHCDQYDICSNPSSLLPV